MTTEAKQVAHTGGSWIACRNGNVEHEFGYVIVRPGSGMSIEGAQANARLIAAAPEMLEALRFLMQTTWKSDDKDNMEFVGRVTCDQLDKARAALSKAGAA